MLVVGKPGQVLKVNTTIPADPKLLVSRFEPEKLSQFFLTSIEQQPRRELLLPADVGVPIRYNVRGTTAAAAAAAGSGVGRKNDAGSRFQMGQQPQELSREQQLADIEGTFTAAQQRPRHPTKPHLTPEVVLPIFPDTASWCDKYVTVHFEEGDPAQDSKTLAQVKDADTRAQLVSRCMIKSYQPHTGSEPAMGLLVPRDAAAAAAKGNPLSDGCSVKELEGGYNWECEYSFDLITRESDKPPDMLLLLMRPDRVGYCHFDGQVRLRKRKRQEGDEPRPEKACIFNRAFRPAEEQERGNRLVELQAYDAAADMMMGDEEELQEEGMEDTGF
eukprot:gene7791-7988_t